MLNQFYKPTVLAGAILAILGFQSVAEAESQFQMKNTPSWRSRLSPRAHKRRLYLGYPAVWTRSGVNQRR